MAENMNPDKTEAHDRIEYVRTVGPDGSFGAWSTSRLQP